MIILRTSVILLCLLSVTVSTEYQTSKPDFDIEKVSHIAVIDVDKIESDHPTTLKHKKDWKTEKTVAKLNAQQFDRVQWISKSPFKVIRIEEMGKGTADRNPFYLPTEVMIAAQEGPNKWLLDSNAPKKDLVYETDSDGNEIPNIYKAIFVRVNPDGTSIPDAPEIDPHIAIHSGKRVLAITTEARGCSNR